MEKYNLVDLYKFYKSVASLTSKETDDSMLAFKLEQLLDELNPDWFEETQDWYGI